ncbi:MAG: LysR family transcriptional regulator [Burkholderiales bacterium]|nr:LysR family transcriptional regulator [Burkholderiales bacterium]
METKWLEDFVSLAETRSFSRSAQLRHVTQPAFSRRIQALEAWTGIDLVDRSSYPTRLTPAGETLHAQALEILEALNATRNMMRGFQAAGQDTIEFAVPHTLAFTFFPHWLMGLRQQFKGAGAFKTRLTALNVHDAVLRLTEGGCDLLIAYHHDALPLQLASERYEMLSLGTETLAPYSKPREAANGGPLEGAKAGDEPEPLFRLPPPRSGSAGSAVNVPFLAYAPGAYMARVVEMILQRADVPLPLDAVYETDMAEGLKAMALEGHGLAFLPESSVRQELCARRLVRASAPGRYEATMEVRIYRERPEGARHGPKAGVQALWEFLGRQSAA